MNRLARLTLLAVSCLAAVAFLVPGGSSAGTQSASSPAYRLASAHTARKHKRKHHKRKHHKKHHHKKHHHKKHHHKKKHHKKKQKLPTGNVSCFMHPGACGFPDPARHNVGAKKACGHMRSSGSMVITQAGRTVSNRNIHGNVTIQAPHVTLNNVCVTVDGHAQLGSWAIILRGGANGTLIKNSTISGVDSYAHSVEIAAMNWSGRPAKLERVKMTNCGECVHDGPWVVQDSYMKTNGMRNTSDHYEDVYCNNTSVKLIHDTALNPENQVANVFCDTNNGSGGPCVNHVTVLRSLLGGGGFPIYACGNSSSVGTSTMVVRNNMFTRCHTGPITYNAQAGGYACKGTLSYAAGAGADKWGYWPLGGYYGRDSYTYCPPASNQVWSGNIWDDNHKKVPC